MSGMELLGTVLSLYTSPFKQSGGVEHIVEVLKHVLVAQFELRLQYKPELSSVILYLFSILIDSELEHEQLCILKFLLFVINWKSENGMFPNLFDASVVIATTVHSIPSTEFCYYI